MKKHLLPLILLSIMATGAFAQILNAGFEQARPNGGPANWGRIVLQPSPCNVAQGYDSVYFRVKEPHTGVYALEMRNAHCDNSSFYAGSAILMEVDTNYFGQGVPFTGRPANISFFYKLLPVGGDVGHVSIQLVDDINGVMVADAEFDVTQATPDYLQANVPLTYYEPNTPTRITIMFSMVNNTDHVHYGSRFLVDDVSALTTGVHDISKGKGVLVIYPNPIKGLFTIKSEEDAPVQMVVTNMLGQTVMNAKVPVNTAVEMPDVANGLYTYQLFNNENVIGSGKLIKE